MILILAAFETTSTALSSILYLLARHEDVQDKVIEEIDEVLNGKSAPSYEDLSKLAYTTQVKFYVEGKVNATIYICLLPSSSLA